MDCKNLKIVWGSNPKIALGFPNESPGSWNQHFASLVTRGSIERDRDRDIQMKRFTTICITMSRGGNSWKLTLPRNENHLTCLTRRFDERKGFPLSTTLRDLHYYLIYRLCHYDLAWTPTTPRRTNWHDRSASFDYVAKSISSRKREASM